MNVLVINAGSSSLKYQVVSEAGVALVKGSVERLSGPGAHETAVAQVVAEVKAHDVAAVGHRVVHGGDRFVDAVLITDEVERAIEATIPLAPLHNPANLAGIRAARAAFPGVPQVAVFDTAFHARMPRRARSYAVSGALAERFSLKRYGFHGTSHGYVAELAAGFLGRPLATLRLITLHLGNGASACAVEFGHSTETSMGLTPMEGLVMGTRSGDIDPGAIIAMIRGGLSVDEVERILNHESGLKGLSGASNDLRDIERRAEEGDEAARGAIAVFAHRVRKYIGAYAAVMGGLDAVVLTGGIGENATAMRRRILQRLDVLGLVLDEDLNATAKLTDEAPVRSISAEHSPVSALVVRTNEERAIAAQTRALCQEKAVVKPAGPIPIAISGRHVHLDAATFEKLFGPGKSLTRSRDISQPGQYACEEKVNLIGPRNRIDGVRVLGPLRPATQVEVSRTDEFFLGVDAPIRDSGQTRGSAPITLEGPAGTVNLTEGLICAKRHIHMTPDDARAYGVSDGDEVEVAISGGPRDLTFGDVLVRVSPRFKLEMHIDTDEANAAELSAGAQGALSHTYTDVPSAQAVLQRRRLGQGGS